MFDVGRQLRTELVTTADHAAQKKAQPPAWLGLTNQPYRTSTARMHFFTRRRVPANARERRPVIANAPRRPTCFGSSSNDTRTSALAAQRLVATCGWHAALRGGRGWLASRPGLRLQPRLRHRSSYCCSNRHCKSSSKSSNDEPDARRAVPHGGNGSSSTNSNRCSSSSRSNQPFGSPWPAPSPGAKSRSRPRTASDHRLVHDSSLAPPFQKGTPLS